MPDLSYLLDIGMYGAQFVAAAAVIVVGGVIRGFGGFGSSIVWVVGLTLIITPSEAVPIIFALEIAASIWLWPSARAHADWHSLRPMLLGSVIALPVGVYLLSTIDSGPMTRAIAIIALVSAILIARGARLGDRLGPLPTAAVGGASGLLNGMSSAGGPPVVLYYMASPMSVPATRASLIFFLGAMDTAALAAVWAAGLVESVTLARALAFAPFMLFGSWVGKIGFRRVPEHRSRAIVLAILVTVSVVALYMSFQ